VYRRHLVERKRFDAGGGMGAAFEGLAMRVSSPRFVPLGLVLTLSGCVILLVHQTRRGL